LKTKKIIKYRSSLQRRKPAFFEAAEYVCNYYYSIKYNGQNLDIVCPCYRLADETEVTVIPWYLIIGRPYPLQVYQFACSYYSANPGVGQRGAAAATREKFNLRTFSHSTVSRSFKSFEKSRKAALEKKYGEEIIIGATEEKVIISVAAKGASIKGAARTVAEKKPHTRKRFPTAGDTAERRKAMAGFLPKFQKGAKRIDIEAAGCQFAKDWNEKNRRLLL